MATRRKYDDWEDWLKKKQNETSSSSSGTQTTSTSTSSSTSASSTSSEDDMWNLWLQQKAGGTDTSPSDTYSKYMLEEQQRQDKRKSQQELRDKLSTKYEGKNPIFRTLSSGFSSITNTLDKSGIMDAADARSRERDLDFYSKMYDDAAKTGDAVLANKAQVGYDKAYKEGTANVSAANYKANSYIADKKKQYEAWLQEQKANEDEYFSQLKTEDQARYYREAYAAGREKGYSAIDPYKTKIEDALSRGDFAKVNELMHAMLQAPLTPAERAKATRYIDEIYARDELKGSPDPDKLAMSNLSQSDYPDLEIGATIDKITRSAETNEYGRLMSTDEGIEMAREIEKRYNIPASLAFSDQDRYISEIQKARTADPSTFGGTVDAAYHYFSGGKETWQTENANAAFRQRTDLEFERARNNPGSGGAQMDSFTKSYNAIQALDQIEQMVDNVDQSVGVDNYTVRYLLKELEGYGVSFDDLNDENVRERIRNALIEQRAKNALMQKALKQSDYDVDAIMQRLDYDRALRYEQDRAESAEKWSKSAGFWDKLAVSTGIVAEDVFLRPVEGIATFNKLVATPGGDTRDTSSYVPVVGQTYQSDLLKGAISNEMSGLGSFVYNALMSTAESTLGGLMLGEVGYLAAMGANAATSKAEEVLQRGGNRAQAAAAGITSGVIEILSEKISIENLFKIKADVGNALSFKEALKTAAKGFGAQSFFEGSEEVFGETMDIIADSFYMGNLSETSQAVQEYMSQGLDYFDALTEAWKDNAVQILEAGAAGALSGGFSSGAYAAAGVVQNTGQIRSNQAMDKMRTAYGETVATEEGSHKAVMDFARKNKIDVRSTFSEDKGKNPERAFGKVATESTSKLAEQMKQGGSIESAVGVYNQTVSEYGDGIRGVADNALRSTVRAYVTEHSGATSDTISKFKDAAAGIEDERVRSIVQDTIDNAVYSKAMQANDEAQWRMASDYRRNHGQEMTMQATVTSEDGSERQVGIESVDTEAGTVKLAGGETVSFDSLIADPDTKDVVHAMLASDMTEEASIKMIRTFQAQTAEGMVTDPYRWAMDYVTSYDRGRVGSFSLEKAQQSVDVLHADTVKIAYEAGQAVSAQLTQEQRDKLNAALAIREKGASGRAGSLDVGELAAKIEADEGLKAEVERIRKFAEVFGIDVGLFESGVKNGRYQGENGRYQDGKIWLDINAGRNKVGDVARGMVQTMAHEMTHFMQEYNPEDYAGVKRFVMQQIAAQKGENAIKQLVAEKKQRHTGSKPLSTTMAEDEIVADFCEDMLTDKTALETMARENPKGFQALVQWIKDFMQKAFDKLAGRPAGSYEVQVYRSMEQSLRDAFGEAWGKGIVGAVQTHDVVGSLQEAEEVKPEGQNSDRDSSGRELSEGQQEYFKDSVIRDSKGRLMTVYHGTEAEFNIFDFSQGGKNGSAEGYGIYLTTDRNVSESYGGRIIEGYANIKRPATSWKKTIKRAELAKLIKTTCLQEAQKMVDDGEYDSVKDALFDTWISNYIMTYESPNMELNYKKAADVILQANDNDMDIIQEVIIGQGIRSYPAAMEFYHNALIPATGIDGFWTKWRAKGQGVDADVILAFDSNQVKNVDNQNPTENPDIRKQDRDTEYLELAKDPKKNAARLQEMVDEAAKAAGYTIKAYHGTPKKFNVFSKDRIGSTTDYGWFGKGFYFTEKKDVASVYAGYLNDSNVIEAYLNVHNPFDFNEYPGAEDKTAGQIMEEVTGKKYGRRGELTEDDKAQRSEDFTEWLRKNKYDGVRAWSQIMILDSEQAKRSDPVTYDDKGNVIPLSERFNPENEDIRYSDRDYFADMSEKQVQEELTRLQQEKATAREKQRNLEKTDEYKRLFQDVLDKQSPEAISAFNKWADESGYVAAVDLAKDVDARLSEGAKVLDRLIDQRMEREEQEAIQKSGKSEAEYFGAQAVKEFGYTPYFYDAGYIVPNGKMLNFSGQKGRHFGSRGQDHRAIGMIYATTKGSAAMNRFMNQGNVRIMAESPGIDISNVTPLTKEQYATIRRFVNEARSDEYFNLDFSDERGNNLGSIEYEGRFTADRVLNDIRHFFETGEVRQPSGLSAFYSERDNDAPSDVDLIEGLDESKADTPEGKALVKDAKRSASKIRELRKQLDELIRQNPQLQDSLESVKSQFSTTDRKLRTKGISGVSLGIMKELGAGDAKDNGVAKRITEVLTQVYQDALDQIDAGVDAGTVMDGIYNEGVMRIVDILARDATHSEKFGRHWETVPLGVFYGEEGRQALIDTVNAAVTYDFVTSRYRDAIQATAADEITERVEGRMQKKIDEVKAQNTNLSGQNRQMSEEITDLRKRNDDAQGHIEFLDEQVQEARKALKDTTKMTEAERKKAKRKADRLAAQLAAARKTAHAMKGMLERRMLVSEHEAQMRKVERERKAEQAAARKREAALQADVEGYSRWGERAGEAIAAAQADSAGWEHVADLSAKEIDRLMRDKRSLIKKLEDQIAREERILQGVLKPPAIQKMLKDARETAAKEMAKHKDEVFARAKDRKRASELRSRIKNLSDEMKRRMTKPTDTSYVPASLYGSMTKLADVLDDVLAPDSGTKAEGRYRAVMEALHSLNNEYDAVKNLDDYTYSSEFDQEIKDQITELERILSNGTSWVDELTGTGRRIRDFSATELQQIYDIMRQINQTMVNATKLMAWNAGGNVYDAMKNVISQQQSMKGLNSVSRHQKNKRLRLLDNLSVMRAVEMMSGWDRSAALYQLMHAIEQGVVDSDSWMMNYNKALQDLKTGKNEKAYRDAMTKKLDYGVTDEEGDKVMMTKMQALQILMTAEREAANKNLVHLQLGGAVIRDAIAIQDGKVGKAKSQTIKVTPELLQRIRDGLTAWDRSYMQTVRNYLQKEGRETNQIMYKLKHRVLQTEAMYVPYVVDKNYLDTNLDEAQAMSMWVKTPGSTNALQRQAKQPVIIDGMDTVMNRHVKEIADYIGLALPVRDFSKVYNGMMSTGGDNPLPVKKTIDRTFGGKGQHLLTQTVIDVQGGSRGQSWESSIAEHLNKLQGAFVRSALLINPSVTIKQAASYTAAESILSHAALITGNRPLVAGVDKSHSPSLIAQIFATPQGRTAQRIYNEIDQYTSMHYQRRLGMSQAELANEANRTGAVKRWMNGIGASMEQTGFGHAIRKTGEALNPVSWIQRMDVATTAALWVACKEQAKMDGMKVGSTEYWERTTELYERCLRETQPMYDGLHRTANQKQQKGIMQYLFPFRTVPIQNHGQIAASYENLLAAKQSGDKARIKEANRFFAKTVWAQTESAVVFSVMTFLAAMLKRKTKKYRDEDEEADLWTVLQGIGLDTASTWFSDLFPVFGSELWSVGDRIINKVTGKNAYSFDAFSVGAVDLLNSLAESGDKLWTDFGKAVRGEEVTLDEFGKHGLDMVLKAAKIAGIPADTIKTYWAGLIGNIKDLQNGQIPALNDDAVERKNAVNVNRYWKAWVAGDDAKMQAIIAEMRQNYLDDGREEDKADELTRNALGGAVLDRYDAEELDLQELSDFMEGTGLWTDEKRQDKLAGIIRDECQAGLRTEDETIDLLTEICGWDEDKAWKKAKEWSAKAEHADEEDYAYSQYDEIDAAIDANQDIGALVKELTDHGTKAESVSSHVKQKLIANYVAGGVTENALKNQLARYCGITAKDDVEKILKDANSKKSYGVAYSSLDEEYRAGHISRTDLVRALKQYGGLSDEDANKKVRWYDLQKKYPDMDITEAWSNHYYDGTSKTQENGHQSASAAGMTVKQYVDAMKVLSNVTGTDLDNNGKTDTNSKEIAYIAAIDAMNLTGAQKWALYYEVYKGANWKKVARPNW